MLEKYKPIPQQKSSKARGGFSAKVDSSSKKNNKSSVLSLFPCDLSEDIKKLSLLSNELVNNWGDRTLTILELEDRIATAAEKAPTEDKFIASRNALSDVKNEYEKVLIQEEENVRNAGGLHVIGTERHESRRVDNQLRGRAGRQGDLGSTRSLSLEDNLLRIFGGDRVVNLMNALGSMKICLLSQVCLLDL